MDEQHFSSYLRLNTARDEYLRRRRAELVAAVVDVVFDVVADAAVDVNFDAVERDAAVVDALN